MAQTRSVLIIGGSGFVGTHLALRMREQFKVFLTYHKHPIQIPGVTALPLAADNRNWAKRVAYTAKPDAIVYVAGSNNVDIAEANPRMAEHIHVGGPATVSDVADILQPKFIYVSNCYVFDGGRGNYHESDTVLPNTALGKSKLGGENFIRGRSLNWAVVRSVPLIGRGNGLRMSFFDRLRISLDRGERIELPNHEAHSFTHVSGLTDMIVRLVESGVRNKVLHFGGLTKLTYYEWAHHFARRFGYDPALIVPSRAAYMRKGIASDTHSRGDYSLNCSQAVEMLKIKPLLMEECFDLIDQQLIPRS
jgi:dTDP-4-dehydrorhamnose reductase